MSAPLLILLGIDFKKILEVILIYNQALEMEINIYT